MARFIRDEKRTYPITWLAIGGFFAFSAAWATYAELVTRVPWQEHQDAFFDMELEQSKQALDRAKGQWEQEIEPSLKDRVERQAEITKSKESGDYAVAAQRLAQLNEAFAKAEVDKTFGGSDLDEAYYYRNLAEYDRDKAGNEARDILAANGVPREKIDAIYADPPAPERGDAQASPKIHHLKSEIARMGAHVAQIDKAMGEVPPAARAALEHSKEMELAVVEKLKSEVQHQERVDRGVAAMALIDGPPEPQLSEKDPKARAEEQKRERERVCQATPDTRNCITWLRLEPVDLELKAIDVEIAKRRRPLTDAEQRNVKADTRANPKFDTSNVMASLVGPFQIQQVVMHWIEYDREVDMEQVDRCHTCHMGVDSSAYGAATIPLQFRTHPMRSTLLATHPVEKFGCTSCHQGQGRATDMLSHSGWVLEEHHGEERWHFTGDHYWEDPLLPIGSITRIIIDERNDAFEVKINKNKWETITIDHRSPAAREADPEVAAEYKDEKELFGAIQEKLAALVDAEADVKDKWHAVVRRLDNRVQIGVEPIDPSAHIAAKDAPTVGLRFPKTELAELLGFGGLGEVTVKQPMQTAVAPSAVPIRSDGMNALTKDGHYTAPRGADGLQVPDTMRNRFIEALPEVESSCLRCHQGDVDLKPRGSRAKYNAAKLDYERAEADRKTDPEGYKTAHAGSDELPAVPPDPAKAIDPTPTFDEGRALFRSLNCSGCHILDNFPWDRNAGPQLNDLTAKVSPEWLLQWIRDPRGWRAKTSMPNLWPRPLDPASKRPYPEGSPEFEKWEELMRQETVAVASFLVERSDNPASRPGAPKDAQPLKEKIKAARYGDLANATPEKGKQIFEAYGCQGCHARSEKDTATEKLPEPWRSRERDVAPTLSNMGSKTSAEWIAYWVEEPSRYWHGTKMPDLRLTTEEAASVGKYIASLKEAPAHPAAVAKDDVDVVSDAAKRNEKVPCANAGGALLTRVECGEKLIGFYGCFGCHSVDGFEKSAPVAPELGSFAKKDVTTLDFGYAISDHHMQTTETFATLKLDSPRIYRRDRIELKMGDFDLSPREIRSLVLFLKGLVAVKPKPGYNPAMSPTYSAALEGRQLVEDLNCRACHVLEDRGGDIDGFRQAALSADGQARAPYLNGEGARVQPEWLFTFLREPGKHGIRPWLHPEWAYGNAVPDDKHALRMPTFTLSSEQITAIVRYFASWDSQDYPYQAPRVNELAEDQKLYVLTHMNAPDAANCLSCHFAGDFPVARGQSELAKMAPNLNLVHKRLRPEWVKAWLLKPQNWMPYTKMTAFWATVDREKDNPMWPSESDPFRSPTPKWNKVQGFPEVTVERQVEMVRDFLFGLTPDSKWPALGQEAASPLVKQPSLEAPTSEAADDKDADKKDGKDTKDKDKKKRTGAIPGPARL